MIQFKANIILKGKMECLTGLHIGGSKEKMEIGGVDNPVIRDPQTKLPYVPGSSLKGKLRSLLAFSLGKAETDMKDNFNANCPIQRIFGTSAENRNIGPSRLLVRDLYADEKTIRMWENLDSELLYTEYKPENSISRLTSAANPRFQERVVKGSVFNVELIYGIYEDADVDSFTSVIESLKLLEHSALGKSGSRGYGQVSFKFDDPIIVRAEDYKDGGERFKKANGAISTELKTLSDLNTEIIQELKKQKEE
jgi:CRISPR-associated protein Csm3